MNYENRHLIYPIKIILCIKCYFLMYKQECHLISLSYVFILTHDVCTRMHVCAHVSECARVCEHMNVCCVCLWQLYIGYM